LGISISSFPQEIYLLKKISTNSEKSSILLDFFRETPKQALSFGHNNLFLDFLSEINIGEGSDLKNSFPEENPIAKKNQTSVPE